MDKIIYSTHITRHNLEDCLAEIKLKCRQKENLIVMVKPSCVIMATLCRELKQFINQIEFCFIINTTDENMRVAFEPFEPSVSQRLQSLQMANKYKYDTSVFCNPLLGGVEDLKYIYYATKPYLTGCISVGICEDYDDLPNSNLIVTNKAIRYIKSEQTDNRLRDMRDKYYGNAMIQFQESITKRIKE